MPDVETWVEYRLHLVSTLERLDRDIIKLEGKVDQIATEIIALRIEFGMQKVRTGLLGAAAGSLPMLVVALIWYLTKR